MSDILRSLGEDAAFLKNALIGARAAGVMTAERAQRAISSCAQIIQSVAESEASARQTGDLATAPLSEFFNWPNTQMPCPKCGRTKRRNAFYLAATERIKHECWCGYFIYTKTLDNSASAEAVRDDWDMPLASPGAAPDA